MPTADEVINALERALKATWVDCPNTDPERITADALELLEQYRRHGKRKYYLLQKHVSVDGVCGLESVVVDEELTIISHTRKMTDDAADSWQPSLKGRQAHVLGAEWIPVGGEKTLEEVIEWTKDLKEAS